MRTRKIIFIIGAVLCSVQIITAQSSNFSVEEYKNFLAAHQNLSSNDLLSMYDAGEFQKHVTGFPNDAIYLDSIAQKFNLTDYENQLLQTNSFMVTERVSNSFLGMYTNIWHQDLPLFISTDAILKAFHLSYDLVLKNTEIDFLIPKLEELLDALHSHIADLDSKYGTDTAMVSMLKDVDVYLTVPRRLLDDNSQPYYADNAAVVDHYLDNINNISSNQPVVEPVFSETKRKMDYSQFTVRGHYTDSQYPQLAKYFKAMIWLGRTELYLIAPVAGGNDLPSKADVQRQIIDSYLISELVAVSNASVMYDNIETTLKTFVGDQDNVTLTDFNSVKNAVNIASAESLLDTNIVKEFQDTLAIKPYAGQKILSQLLESDPFNPDKIEPASAFLLFGQRFIIDSYITGNVVYDRIVFENQKIKRMLPSTLDVLFALGNSAAAQILQPEIDQYKYASNMASLRYLVDSYGQDFWEKSIYNLWLNSIRSLNPPTDKDRNALPPFMQTAAWWQEKMNTQSASWAELRHDNLLYAKQSYSGMPTCSYPYTYVEPLPGFFHTMGTLASLTAQKLTALSIDAGDQVEFFNGFANIMDTLETIASKELTKEEFTEKEKVFLKSAIYDTTVSCGIHKYNGWYYNKLLYHNREPETLHDGADLVVADIHTSPADESGNIVGWVKHAGVGYANLAVVVADLPGVGNVAFAGPVSSFYEYTTKDFKRITDEQWQTSYLREAARPNWVNIYLAGKDGNTKGEGAQLATGVKSDNKDNVIPNGYDITVKNYPNPFNPSTNIVFTIPQGLSNKNVELKIYDINGQLIKKLVNEELPAGNYIVRWDGKNEAGRPVSSGIYIYNLKAGGYFKAGKMNLLK